MRTEVIEEQYIDELQLSLEEQATQIRQYWQDILTDGSWTVNEVEASELLTLAKGDLSAALDAMTSVASDIRKRNFKLTDFMPDEILGLVHKELEDLGRAKDHMNVQPTQDSEHKAERARQGRMSREEQIQNLIEAYKARVKADDPLTVEEVQGLLGITGAIGILLQSFNLSQHFLRKQKWRASHEEILGNLRENIVRELETSRIARERKVACQN